MTDRKTGKGDRPAQLPERSEGTSKAASDSDFETRVTFAEQIMSEDRDLLRRLAE